MVAQLTEAELTLWACPDIATVREQLADAVAVGIDMPIALVEEGRREAETQLRAALGSSARSVFTSPTRAAVAATSQTEATRLNREHGGPGISAQAFGLFASIRELRVELEGVCCRHWWETHPETSFALLNGGPPLASKRTARGVAERLSMLSAHFPDLQDRLLAAPAKVPVDDVLDAVAAAWSAQRISHGTARVFGPAGRDDQGFPLGIRI